MNLFCRTDDFVLSIIGQFVLSMIGQITVLSICKSIIGHMNLFCKNRKDDFVLSIIGQMNLFCRLSYR